MFDRHENLYFFHDFVKQLREELLEMMLRYQMKIILILSYNALVHRNNRMQLTIREMDFVQLNHPAYSPVNLPTDYYTFSHLKTFPHN